MKRFHAVLSFLLICGFLYYGFYSMMPRTGTSADIPDTEFSTERALVPLKEISKAPHFTSSEALVDVREYLLQELTKLGLQPETQEGFVIDTHRGSLNKPINILARLEGSENGKALLVFTHYDSALVPSYGASDAGSGVVTILESIRAFKASGKQPKNDIIILFTDGEETGLDGAKLFVREHPWAKDVGLSLNFEARGSGGPSNMILETNHGNANLIKAFQEANPDYPVATSLMYSIYKMLPNDTDSTVLREEGDLDGFFFAFIDDHYDYHTANDNYENLDRNTLQHQGSYLLPLLHYFGDAPLENTRAETDHVYFNFPWLKLLHYPFSWVIPMVVLAWLVFIALLVFGIKKRTLSAAPIGKGFLPFLLSMILAGVVGFFGWKFLLWLYPHYGEIQHGFTYNGHTYIAFFVMLSLAITFFFYRNTKKTSLPSTLVAPLFFWLLINTGVALALKGAGYFIIPVFFAMLSFFVLLKQERSNILLLTLFAVPALFIFGPLIQFFPVGLGLKMIVISCVFTVLLAGLVLPVLGFYTWKRLLSGIFMVLAILFFISAHFSNDFSETQQKPNSLVYFQDVSSEKAYWTTYDKILDPWTKGYLGEDPEDASNYVSSAAGSKYGTSYSYASEAPYKTLPKVASRLEKDTVVSENNEVVLTLIPQRKLHQMNVYTSEKIPFTSLRFNGKEIPPDSTGQVYGARESKHLLTYFIKETDSLEIAYSVSGSRQPTFIIQEYSYDLLTHSQFSINKRPKNTMPKPFVVTDAIIQKHEIDMQELLNQSTDSLRTTLND